MVLYTNNTPQATQTIAATQPIIQANFTYLPLFGNVDHDFASDSATTTNGFHSKVTFKANTAAPGFGAGVSVAYADTVNGVSSLCFQNASGSFAITGTNPSPNSNGYTCLPGGVILQWGSANIQNQATKSISFNIPFPNNAFNAQVTYVVDDNTTIRSGIQFNTPILTTSGFTWIGTNDSAARFIYWMAIGN